MPQNTHVVSLVGHDSDSLLTSVPGRGHSGRAASVDPGPASLSPSALFVLFYSLKVTQNKESTSQGNAVQFPRWDQKHFSCFFSQSISHCGGSM